ncbi:flagellar basal body-associated protein FliL [Cedecea colo]|uniref:Flagellar protein FliL n=1 Tax=Cedecea colo TaxID=2552946 RepID=A0ABX0VQ06_9ENTR|nr:flagellar basal body-associated protein FliL [Cedecea colo]NIY48660.1 flagellar basal body-associated protein FliL [Cedecea colo]
MSKNNKNDARPGKKNTIIILLLLLLVLGACGFAGFTFYEINKMKSGAAANAATAESEPVEESAPTYIPMDTFTVSLKPDEGNENSDRVLYIGLTLRVKDDRSKELVEKFLPEIRSRLLILFSEQTSEYLSTSEGKLQLINEIKTIVSQPLVGSDSANVTDVLFNAFILR